MMNKTEEELIWESYDNSLITERDQGIDHGCLMVYLDDSSANEIKQFCQETFNPEILAEFGIEEEPHITCQYGFTDDVSVEDINEFVNKIIQRPISIDLGEISRFEQDEYDVIKVDVNSPDLHELSDKIREYFGDNLNITYPNYHPHMTLAYVQKGSLPHIDGDNMFKGKNHVFTEFVYSDSSNNKYDIIKESSLIKEQWGMEDYLEVTEHGSSLYGKTGFVVDIGKDDDYESYAFILKFKNGREEFFHREDLKPSTVERY